MPVDQEGVRSPRRRWLIAALAALIPLAPIVAGIVIASGAGGAGAATTAGFTALGTSAPPVLRAAPTHSQTGVVVALVRRATTMRDAPAGRPIAQLHTHTEFGSPQALWVVARQPGWLGVVSPLAGNGKTGWIPRSVATLTRVPWQLKVSLSQRRLTVIEDGHPLVHYTVAIGASWAPTPTGRFAVTDRLQTGDPSGPYGCCILALSAHSPHTIQGWTGGDRIAIHSTPDASSIGQAASHGCVRVTIGDGRWLMNHVPLGTPTYISS